MHSRRTEIRYANAKKLLACLQPSSNDYVCNCRNAPAFGLELQRTFLVSRFVDRTTSTCLAADHQCRPDWWFVSFEVFSACAQQVISIASPSGSPLSSPFAKNKSLSFFQKTGFYIAIPPHSEGRFAIVTNVEVGGSGRETSQRILAPTNDGLADGQAVWS
jgi:hypothetical protein